jgi:hypothetical protein
MPHKTLAGTFRGVVLLEDLQIDTGTFRGVVLLEDLQIDTCRSGSTIERSAFTRRQSGDD